MRTTVTLDDDLDSELRSVAHQLKKPFKSVLNDAIRRGLGAGRPAARPKRFVVEPRACRLRPGLDETRFNQILDELDTDDAAGRVSGAK